MPVNSPETKDFFYPRPKAEDEKNSEVEVGIYRHIARQNPIYIIYIPFFKPLTQKNENFFSRLWLELIILTPRTPKGHTKQILQNSNFLFRLSDMVRLRVHAIYRQCSSPTYSNF